VEKSKNAGSTGLSWDLRQKLDYDRRGEYDRAIADYSEAMRLSPTSGSAYTLNRRGYAYHAKGEYDRAIADYNEAIQTDSKYVFAYHNRGFSYFTKGQYECAIADYSEAIRLDPGYAISYRNRGIAHLYIGSHAKALADLEMAAQLMPKDAYIALWREISSRQADGTQAASGSSVPSSKFDVRFRSTLAHSLLRPHGRSQSSDFFLAKVRKQPYSPPQKIQTSKKGVSKYARLAFL
jgi:tetratricopeptide (TPR) repeat protein